MPAHQQNDHGKGWQVSVPATSANLGCAFDCAGLALRLYLHASFVPSQNRGLTLEYSGETTDRIPLDGSNLVLRALELAAQHFGASTPSGRVVVESHIPVGVGLGSSAAAIVAGLLLGARAWGKDFSPQELLRCAGELEGHLDNAAAAIHGGLVFALQSSDRVVALKCDFPEAIRLVIVTPAAVVSTHKARRVLPGSYKRADVVHTLQRTALLAATCFAGKFELFPELFDDRVHQPYRQKLVPGIAACLRYRHDGLLGVAISGSGSSVIAFARKNENEIARELKDIFAADGVKAEALITSADNSGAKFTAETQSHGESIGWEKQRQDLQHSAAEPQPKQNCTTETRSRGDCTEKMVGEKQRQQQKQKQKPRSADGEC